MKKVFIVSDSYVHYAAAKAVHAIVVPKLEIRRQVHLAPRIVPQRGLGLLLVVLANILNKKYNDILKYS